MNQEAARSRGSPATAFVRRMTDSWDVPTPVTTTREVDCINEVRDFFDGRLFRDFHLRELGLFKDPHDVALHMSNQKVTPAILMNLNLPPQERYMKDSVRGGHPQTAMQNDLALGYVRY